MRFSTIIVAYAAAVSAAALRKSAANGRFKPQQVDNIFTSLFIGSEISITPSMQAKIERFLNNPIGQGLAQKSIQYIVKNQDAITSFALNAMPDVPTASTEDLKPLYGVQYKRSRVRYGPVTLPAANITNFATKLTGETGSIFTTQRMEPYCSDCLVIAGRVYGHDSQIYDHHLSTRNADRLQPLMGCTAPPNLPLFSMMGLGSGEESLASVDALQFAPQLNVTMGQIIGLNDRYYMAAELINYNPEPKDALETQELLVNIGPCSEVAFIPDKEEYSKTGTWVSPADGYLLQTAAHLHDGGKRVLFKLNGKEICDSTLSYSQTKGNSMGMGMRKRDDKPGELTEVVAGTHDCDLAIPLKKGDKIEMTAEYDLKTHPLRTSATGKQITVMAVGALKIATAPGANLQMVHQ